MGLIFALKGRQGDKGDKGDQGDIGDKGDQGDQGDQGISSYDGRGDVDEHDFSIANFTRDGDWHELDLSGIVGAGVKLLLIKAWVATSTVRGEFSLRTHGHTNSVNKSSLYTQAPGWPYMTDMWVLTDAYGKIDYWAEAETWGYIYLLIRGYFAQE